VTALHAFWKWCESEYHLAKNPMDNIRRPRRPAPQPKAIDPANFIKIFEATSPGRVGYRDRAILCFLADSGFRMAGLLDLTKDRLLLDQRKAICAGKRR
jgi:integrase/recombinase XerD